MQNKRVAEIKSLYKKAKEMAEQNGKGGSPRNDIEMTANYMVPACGPTTEHTHFFYELQVDGEEMVSFFQPYLVTRRYNIAIRNYYEEYLYDKDRHQLVFAFIQENYPDGEVNEVRFYWGEGVNGEYGQIQQIEKGTAPATEQGAFRKGCQLADALTALLNQN